MTAVVDAGVHPSGSIALTGIPQTVLRRVIRTEFAMNFVSVAIGIWVFVSHTTQAEVLHYHWTLTWAGLLRLFIAAFWGWLLGLMVRPIVRFVVYRGCLKQLYRLVNSFGVKLDTLHWRDPIPRIVGIGRNGRLLFVQKSTGYQPLWLSPDQLVSVKVERTATHHTTTQHGGSVTVGGYGRGGFGGFTSGGRSHSTTHTVETAVVEVGYRFERNGPVGTMVIPFGRNRRQADEWCSAVRLLAL